MHVVYSGVLRSGFRSKCSWRRCCSCSTTGSSTGAKGTRLPFIGVSGVLVVDPHVRRGGGCEGVDRRVVHRNGCPLRRGRGALLLKLLPLQTSVAVVVGAAVVVASVVGGSFVASLSVGFVVVVAVIVVVVGVPVVVGV